jgi:hypothetical protein
LVIALVTILLRECAAMPVGHHVKFAADDGLYPIVLGRLRHELEHPEHIPVVGDGQGFHAIGCGFFEQSGDAGRAVEQRELGMAVEVGEVWHQVKVTVFG